MSKMLPSLYFKEIGELVYNMNEYISTFKFTNVRNNFQNTLFYDILSIINTIKYHFDQSS